MFDEILNTIKGITAVQLASSRARMEHDKAADARMEAQYAQHHQDTVERMALDRELDARAVASRERLATSIDRLAAAIEASNARSDARVHTD